MRRAFARLRDRLRAQRIDADLEREIAAHLDEAAEEYRQRGLPPAEARRAARRDFGGVAAASEAHRDLRSIGWIDGVARDCRHAVRTLRRTPAFAATVLIVLMTCVGAATSGLTLLDAIVFRPLPFPNADRLVAITHDAPGLQLRSAGISSAVYDHYRARAASLDALAVYEERMFTLQTAAGNQRVPAAFTSVRFFDVLGVTPLLGRTFIEADAAPGFMNMKWPVPMLISHRLWIDHLGADAAVAGRVLTVNGNPRVVLGVLPPDFAFPSPTTDLWMLLEPPVVTARFPGDFDRNAIGRLRAGAGIAAARAELAAILPDMAGRYSGATPEDLRASGLQPTVTPLKTAVIGNVAAALWPVFGGMLVLLAIAGCNAAGLFAVRAEHRRLEMALRRALGASPAVVRRLFFAEALILTSASAAGGLLLAVILPRGLAGLPLDLPRSGEVTLSFVPVAFAILTAMAGAALFARVAAGRESPMLTAPPDAGQRSTGSHRSRRLRHALIASQVALALVLLSASALMARTFWNLTRVDLGFSPARLLLVDVSLASRRYRQHAATFTELVNRVQQLPGVERASAVSTAPLTPDEYVFPLEPLGARIAFRFFAPGYFETMGIRISAGLRLDGDAPVTAPDPVVVSAALARRLQADGRPLGARIRRLAEDGSLVELPDPRTGRFEPVPPFVVAGIAGDVVSTSLRSGPSEIVYIPVREPAVERSIVPLDMTLVVRARPRDDGGIPLPDLIAAARREIHAASPDVSVGAIRTMDDVVGAARATETFVSALLIAAAVVSALLGMVGISGTVIYVARQRARETAIRIALGASTPDVVRSLTAGPVSAASIGIVVGIGASLAATRTLESLLYGVDAGDLATLGLAVAGLASAALLAAVVPAWRNAHADPLATLRAE